MSSTQMTLTPETAFGKYPNLLKLAREGTELPRELTASTRDCPQRALIRGTKKEFGDFTFIVYNVGLIRITMGPRGLLDLMPQVDQFSDDELSVIDAMCSKAAQG